MKQILEIYDTVRDLGYCRSQADFSVNWLSRSPSHLAYLKSANAMPSLTTVRLLINKLKTELDILSIQRSTVTYRRLNSAYISARVIHDALNEMKFVPRAYWMTAM